jgi:hypothetical protein
MSAAKVLRAAPASGIRANVNDGDCAVLEGYDQPRLNRSARPVKTRRNRRPDRRRVKSLRTYTIDEAARALEVHRNTVRHWIMAGLRVIDDKRPILILGSDLSEYLLRQREARRQPCCAGQMFCLKCRKPQEPAGLMADFVPSSATAGALVGICPTCNRLMYRRVSIARLSEVAGGLDVHLTRAQLRIEDTAVPNVNCHLGHEV